MTNVCRDVHIRLFFVLGTVASAVVGREDYDLRIMHAEAPTYDTRTTRLHVLVGGGVLGVLIECQRTGLAVRHCRLEARRSGKTSSLSNEQGEHVSLANQDQRQVLALAWALASARPPSKDRQAGWIAQSMTLDTEKAKASSCCCCCCCGILLRIELIEL
ncbi:hypothetical protein EDB85DRAFT_759048 [Lactarius pseudohatsudake]|nr:hypothetical protein EDB85DRAFT_759048 [Lactarius pseudohatsudake]